MAPTRNWMARSASCPAPTPACSCSGLMHREVAMARKYPSRRYRDGLREAVRLFASRDDIEALVGHRRVSLLLLDDLEALCELAALIDPVRLRPRRYRRS